MTNSADNSYTVRLGSNNGKDLVKFNFADEQGTRCHTTISKKDFFKAETINLDCQMVIFQKEKIKRNDDNRYDFFVEKDTLIAGVSYKNYSMQYHKRKEEKQYNSGKAYYIIEPGTESHTPLTLFSGWFDVISSSTKYPNGIAKEMFTINAETKKREFIYKLVKYAPVNKFVVVPKECDYTDPKSQKLRN